MDSIETYMGNRKNSPFLRLPAEIRHQIYDLTITGANKTVLSLLVTCTQINHEALQLLYSNVPLRIEAFGDIGQVLKNKDPNLSSRITSVEISQLYTMTHPHDLKVLKENGLEHAMYMQCAKKLSGLKHIYMRGEWSRGFKARVRDRLGELFGHELDVKFDDSFELNIMIVHTFNNLPPVLYLDSDSDF
ncbi:hypothetical protein PtrSN002B_002779 [Pyrenophora tritici-repentis]|uniref:F-box domain-containing protein n=2 Tax=Pyrenophora tritici-repentis TaxID=45151 RepID=A0A2W1GIK8_9PLEO|nr:uncharacterized protein PTRG_03883 [Pyrenophora tritici-repentis Pt-1C-BFP]KAA8620059.1 hypothetical protein PtrV1_07153 [Pyrenophora tritici-repentis]EDU46721.1 predicted protein [Pyrenophora tritici-repentis Pt-1C-BFP]KAF7448212.1 hypothetical protein A1F99_075760 [Pyrenophora tritici-repentis]KAF7571924.1 hypothetical protein PtrM4_094240 [Pyrenophora tritici-repentis]KAG9384885.1 hypothetical protein A1F94_004432 [Pyrenophora tritici-repentis]